MNRRNFLAASAALCLATPASAQALNYEAAATYSAQRRGVSLVVVRHGEIVFEDYPNQGSAARGWELASGTKSFTGIMAAAAIQDDLISSWDERCAETLSEWRNDERSRITLRHLLSLTSGIEGGPIARPPAYASAIAQHPDRAPGERFAYGPTPFQIFGEIMRDSGHMKYHAEALPVAGMVAEVQGLIRPAANTARVTFTASADPLASFVYADHVRLRQCLLNLLSNAVKFARGGTVTLRATAETIGEQRMIVFTVQDDGVGMTSAELDNIFRPFGQANDSVNKAFGGVGLGLSIARGLARAMGGDITVVSAPGEGATFRLTVPGATAAALKAA